MKRKLPLHCEDFRNSAKLTNPLGRALYLCNRLQNGDFSGYDDRDSVIARLKTIQASTASRWFKHFKSGGSIKSLSHGSAGRVR